MAVVINLLRENVEDVCLHFACNLPAPGTLGRRIFGPTTFWYVFPTSLSTFSRLGETTSSKGTLGFGPSYEGTWCSHMFTCGEPHRRDRPCCDFTLALPLKPCITALAGPNARTCGGALHSPRMAASQVGPDPLVSKFLRSLPDLEVQALFREFDMDRSGIIEKSDLEQALTRMGVRVGDRERAGILAALDVNGDGVIDVKDFGNAVAKLRQEQQTSFVGQGGRDGASGPDFFALEQWLLQYDRQKGARESKEGDIDTVLASLIRKKVRGDLVTAKW